MCVNENKNFPIFMFCLLHIDAILQQWDNGKMTFLTSLGCIQPCLNYCTNATYKYPPQPIAWYTFISLVELEQREMNELAQKLKNIIFLYKKQRY